MAFELFSLYFMLCPLPVWPRASVWAALIDSVFWLLTWVQLRQSINHMTHLPTYNNKKCLRILCGLPDEDKPCGGLRENGLCGPIWLMPFSSVGGSFWKGLGVWPWCHWVWTLRFQKPMPLSLCSLSSSWLWIKLWTLNCSCHSCLCCHHEH